MVKKWSVSYPAVNGVEQRRVYVYLPTMYEADPERRYPVLYMFDGQNVFFDADATYGKSWGMADYLDYTDTPLIVAAVECNAGPNNERLVEYSPYRFDDPTYGHFDGKGQATMSWFIHRFKPYTPCCSITIPSAARQPCRRRSGCLLKSSAVWWAAQSWSPARCSTWTTVPRRWATTRECAGNLPRCAARSWSGAST